MHSASTHRWSAILRLILERRLELELARAETFRRNQSSARASRAVKRRFPPSAALREQTACSFAFITRSTPIAIADIRCEILCAFARRITWVRMLQDAEKFVGHFRFRST